MFGRRQDGVERAPRNLFGVQSVGQLFGRASGNAKDAARTVLPRQKIDRRGFFGGDADGGIERFRRLSAGYTHEELEQKCFAYERDRTVYTLALVATVLMIPIATVYGFGNWYFVIGLCLMIVFTAAKWLQADFAAWRFRQGRMAPLADYLNNKLPSNMQIMED